MTMQTVITDEISAINQTLAEKIGQQKFRIWFKNSARMTLCGEYLKIGVPNAFVGNWIESHFLCDITAALETVLGSSRKIVFNIEPELSGNLRKQADSQPRPAEQPRITPTSRRFNSPQPSARQIKMGLDSFVVGPSNNLAYNAAVSIVSDEVSQFNPLFVHGGHGLGKGYARCCQEPGRKPTGFMCQRKTLPISLCWP